MDQYINRPNNLLVLSFLPAVEKTIEAKAGATCAVQPQLNIVTSLILAIAERNADYTHTIVYRLRP